MTGPLDGLTVIEVGGIGPVPHAGMMLADLGARVIRVDRPNADEALDAVHRGRQTIQLDLKSDADLSELLALVDDADVLVEGYRPGVAERLGFGPEVCTTRNPQLIYGRMTGWGQSGELAHLAGHDINYISITGVLHAIGRERSVPPLNLVGDYAGGSMFLVTGILAALWERHTSGLGQVIDAAIVDGVSAVAQQIWALRGRGEWTDGRSGNLLDSGAPFYDTYLCADGKEVAVGAIEPQFYALVLDGLGLDPAALPAQEDVSRWSEIRSAFSASFMTRTRDEWAERFADSDACVTPVLTFGEALRNRHLVQRDTFINTGGTPQAAPAPRFSRSTQQEKSD